MTGDLAHRVVDGQTSGALEPKATAPTAGPPSSRGAPDHSSIATYDQAVGP